MATFEFRLPDIGEGVVEGEIVKWHVREGDTVAEDQPLVDVMTDKATVTIPSPKAGRVAKTVGAEGEIAKVHGVLVVLEVGGAAASAPTAPVTATVPVTAAAAVTATEPARRVLATPVTRRLAREHGVDLHAVAGTGPGGRVMKADVLRLIEGGAEPVHVPTTALAHAPARALTPPPGKPAAEERLPLRGLRKRIAEAMHRSKTTAAHFTFVEEVDMTELVAFRDRANAALEKDGIKVTFLPFMVKAVCHALKKHPMLNASLDDARGELVLKRYYNIGIAAATDEGLTVPVIHDADKLSHGQLAVEIDRLAGAARDNKLKLEELQGGTFTITSLGKLGGIFATPIIRWPEVAILGIHRIEKRPVVVNDQIVVRDRMYLSLSFDHRVIDGHVGAAFAYEVIRYLQDPQLLFLQMV
jgi:pyruvate dehydrogenase E2 component (dihydrolipoamide acetyltransferase)